MPANLESGIASREDILAGRDLDGAGLRDDNDPPLLAADTDLVSSTHAVELSPDNKLAESQPW